MERAAKKNAAEASFGAFALVTSLNQQRSKAAKKKDRERKSRAGADHLSVEQMNALDCEPANCSM